MTNWSYFGKNWLKIIRFQSPDPSAASVLPDNKDFWTVADDNLRVKWATRFEKQLIWLQIWKFMTFADDTEEPFAVGVLDQEAPKDEYVQSFGWLQTFSQTQS